MSIKRNKDLTRVDEPTLQEFASAPTPTLRKLHAISELCKRASQTPELRPRAIALVASNLSSSASYASMPVGYFGAEVIYRFGGEFWKAFLKHIETLDDEVSIRLLEWLDNQ